MYKHLMAWLAALLLASLAWPAFAQNLVSDQDPLSSLAEDDVSYWVDNVGAYDGKVDLSVLRSEIQERIHGANLQTGTTYELVLSDAGKVVELTNASPITLTIPANASVAFPVNTMIDVVQGGAGAVTINITSDTLNGITSFDGQWQRVVLWKRTATQWVAIAEELTDPDAIHGDAAGEFAGITEKTALSGSDLLLIEDSAASNEKKRVNVSNSIDLRAINAVRVKSYYSGNVEDDAVYTIQFAGDISAGQVFISDNTNSSRGSFAFRARSSPFIAAIGSTGFSTSTNDLTITPGTDGVVTVSATSSNKFQVNNRSGSVRTYSIMVAVGEGNLP